MSTLNEAIVAHAQSVFPQESCGIVVQGRYIPLDNTHATPTLDFSFPARVMIEYAGQIEAIVHSHPNGPECPSSTDMIQQAATDLPWIIVPLYENGTVGDIFSFGEKEKLPLIGRPFRHGVTDCYATIRDAYALGQIQGVDPIEPVLLADCPRDWGWWTVPGIDLYEKNFREWGFRPLTNSEQPQPWDVLLCAVGSAGDTPNHGIVYLGNNLGLHHVGSWRKPYDPSRLSVRENISRWMGNIVRGVRPTWI